MATNTTFGNGVVSSANGMNHYGHSSPVNGHVTYMAYLDDSLSPTTTTTTIATSTYGEQRLLNGFTRPLSPLSPTATKLQTAVGVPGPAPSTSASHLPYAQYQPYGVISAAQPQPYGRYANGNLAPVDLLNGHLAMGTVPNGTCVMPQAIHYGMVGVDSTSVYHPLTGYGDQPPYFPSGVHASPLETVHEVPTPDAMDDPQPPPPMASDQQQIRQIRSSPSSSDGIARCASQLSTHV